MPIPTRLRRMPLLLTLTLAMVALTLPASAQVPGLPPILDAPAPPATGKVRAGVGVVDATWHVGASAGQYASDDFTSGLAPESHFDPHKHQLKRAPSYGIQSRLSARALVVEGANGVRIALVKNDLYIPQDMLWRRTAQILEANGTSGIDRTRLTMMVSHNHSSPFYSSTTFGPWIFQDSFDLRFFEYYAQAQAAAVEKAAASLKPARMGASVSYFDKTHRHSYGPAVADDGTPAGFPNSETDHDMMILRFDDISNPSDPKPLAILANFGLHPEFLDGNDLNSADYVGPLERMVDRETGATLIWSQGAVGTAEPERNSYHSIHERLDFTHKDYQQAEYGARLMANSLIDTWNDVAAGTPEQEGRFIPFSSDFPVEMIDRWFPGPTSHPLPGVANCRTDPAMAGRPRVPVANECVSPHDESPIPIPVVDPGLSTDDFQAAGIPVPENYSVPSYNALQESMGVHMQAAKLGDLLLVICSCEQWSEQTKNIKTRTDLVAGNIWVGFDWTKIPGFCTHNAQAQTWTCKNPGNLNLNLPPITEHEYDRMRAQINNDATGWNATRNVAWAESEPVDPAEILGNFTQSELPAKRGVPGGGYGMTMTIGMANDYNGYIASYREYQRGDHYRKSLTGWGPHSSDYYATRLVEMGGQLNGGPAPKREVLDAKELPDQAIQDAKGHALGAAAAALIPAYEALLPADGGDKERILEQPKDITRYQAAFFSWVGGSNYTDLPDVKVQRLVNGVWQDYADQSGEVVVTLEFPRGPQSVAPYLRGQQQWHWTAHFEAFDNRYANLGPESAATTPPGRYRFVVAGKIRKGVPPAPQDYTVQSREFDVRPWHGITIQDLKVASDGTVSFRTGPTRTIQTGAQTATIGPIDFPDSYASPKVPFIRNVRTFHRDPAAPTDTNRFEWFCNTCSFRPWADVAKAVYVKVTIVDQYGTKSFAMATPPADITFFDAQMDRTLTRPDPLGRWTLSRKLMPGESVFVATADVRDAFGNFNGAPSATVSF